MSSALYNQDGQWEIPGFLWPAVLGTSVAIHISVLIYGLPDMSFLPDDPAPLHETEVIIDSGGLTFAPVQAIESVPTQTAVPSAAPAISPSESLQPVVPQTAVATRPVQENPLQPTTSDAASRPDIPNPANVQVSEAAAALKPSGTPVSAAPVTPVQQPKNLAVSPVKQTVASVQPVTNLKPSPVVSAVQAPATAPISQPGVAPVTPAVSPLRPITGQETGGVEETQTTVPLSVAPPDIRPPAPAQQEFAVSPAQEIVAVTPASSSSVVTGGTAAVAVKQQPNDVPAAPRPVTATAVAATGATAISNVGASSGVVQVESGTVQAVRPVEQKVASLRPTEEEVTAIAPSRPETSTLPVAPQTSDPAQGVAPVEVASIDPLAKVSGYVASYDPGECAHLTVMSAGADSAAVTAYGAGIAPFAVFDQRFAADQGYEAKIEVRLVTREQCALLDALGLSDGVEAAGLVELDRTIVPSGTHVSGLVQRDLPLDRIAAAEAAGVPLNGMGSPELYLIDDGGQIHDGRDYILPASNTLTAGAWRFSVPVTLLSGEDSETALVLAIWNRPEASQPARFGSLPAGRISDVLAAPGVYSLTAFKVSR
ncbi:hypothetical protein [uncultured Roseibium sp.]|uniref:hypothetical protein n=1 Tax=uncultured Roseibium sp. TaxID=1936171 RepID=UPI0026294C53|nr:hypothetical protein [uncultured Roseibium sp.]